MPKIIPERYISSLECEKKGIALYYDAGMYKLKNGKIIKNDNDGSMSEITSVFCCREVNPDNNVRLTNFTISFGRKVFNNLENTLKLTKWYIDPSDLN